jgi:hypothetical protein
VFVFSPHGWHFSPCLIGPTINPLSPLIGCRLFLIFVLGNFGHSRENDFYAKNVFWVFLDFSKTVEITLRNRIISVRETGSHMLAGIRLNKVCAKKSGLFVR